MEGVCVACSAAGVELNDENKCTGCVGAVPEAPAVVAPEAPIEAPAEDAPAEGGDMPAAE